MTDIKNRCIINLSKLDNYFIYQKGGNLIMNVNGIEYENTDTLKVDAQKPFFCQMRFKG